MEIKIHNTKIVLMVIKPDEHKNKKEALNEKHNHKKNYCTQNDGDCPTCSLVNYEKKDCHNNPIDQSINNTTKTLHERAAAMAAYDRHHDSAIIAVVKANICPLVH